MKTLKILDDLRKEEKKNSRKHLLLMPYLAYLHHLMKNVL